MINITTKENLILKSSNIDELDKLNEIYEEVIDYFSFDKGHIITSPQTCLTKGDLPPGGKLENFYTISIYEKEALIGYMTLYKGFPQEDNLYICFLYILKKHRKHGYGKSIVQSITNHFNEQGINTIKISVSLKNWDGIKFWNKCGFNSMTNVDIEGSFNEENYGCIELKKII